jgi:hypothetical protein
MPFYKTLDNGTPEGRRTAEGLLRLKTELDKVVPAKTVDQTLLLARSGSLAARSRAGETRSRCSTSPKSCRTSTLLPCKKCATTSTLSTI